MSLEPVTAPSAAADGHTPEAFAALQLEVVALRDEAKAAVRKRRLEEELKPFQVELLKLQDHLEAHNQRMIVLFEGRDAAGKGGTIRRVTRYMNEKHYRVVALGKPTEEQRSQWYYQRYVAQFPTGGEMVLFDRSWYNRAMVEAVFGFCTDQEYKDFMRGVVGFEKDLVRTGTVLVKLYFSVNKEEQKRRFDRRRDDPLREWKLSEIDVQAQEHWDDFTDMKYRMLKRTSTSEAPVDGDPLREQAPGPPQRHAGDAQRRRLRRPQPRPGLRALTPPSSCPAPRSWASWRPSASGAASSPREASAQAVT